MVAQEYRKKDFVNYTIADVNNWIHDLPNATDIEGEQPKITAALAQKIKDNIDDFEVDGEEVSKMTLDELKDLFPKGQKLLAKKLQKLIRARVNKEADPANDPNNPKPRGNDEKFLITIGQHKALPVTPRMTIAEVLKALHDREGAKLDVNRTDIYHNGRRLDPTKTLAYYNITRNSISLEIKSGHLGGMLSKTKGEIRSSKPFYITVKGNGEAYKLKSCFFCYNKVFLIKIMYLKEMNTKGLRRSDIKLYTKPGLLQRITNQYKSDLYNKIYNKNNNNNNNNNELIEMNDNDELMDYDIDSDTTLTIKIMQKQKQWLVPLKKLDKNGLKEYVHTLSLGGTSQKIYEKKIDGKALNKCKNANDIAQLLGIDIQKAGLLLNAMEQQQKIDKMCENDKIVYYKKTADMYKTNNIKNWNIDQVMAFIASINIDKKYKDIIQGFVKRLGLNGYYFTVIQNVDDLFKETFCNKIPKNICEIIFNELKKYTKIIPAIKPSNNTDSKDDDGKDNGIKKINVIDDPQYKFKKRMLNLRKYKVIKLSKNECCIAKDKIGQRATMICNHAITSESMYKYIKSIYTKTEYGYKIYCPVPECTNNQTGTQYEWDWDLCTKIADMDDDEYRDWTKMRQKRVLKDQKKCPKCDIYNKRNEYIKTKCINCNHIFCWFCSNAWKSNNNNRCGNSNCIKIIQINERLKAAKWEPYYKQYTDYMVPTVRACPSCFNLTDRIAGCLHMHCNYCGINFCFHCLKKKIDNKWQCIPDRTDNKYGFCKVAKVQQF